MNKKPALILSILFTILIASDFYFLHFNDNREKVLVSRVIDGDTIKLDDGRSVRLLNINAPESGTPNAELSKNFLKEYENQTIEIEFAGMDKYSRTLARLYSPDYLNLELVKKGLASKFLVSSSELSQFSNAESFAINHSLGMWSKSEYFNCINISVDKLEELVFIKNSCPEISISGWKLKDESRKTYTFQDISIGSIILHSSTGKDTEKDIFWNSNQSIWNDDRDSAYIFDEKANLAGYFSYGY